MPIITGATDIEVSQDAFPADRFVVCTTRANVPTKGGIVSIKAIPTIPMEGNLLNTELVASLNADGTSGDGVLQVFKSSSDNLHSLDLFISGITVAGTSLDDFETYAGSSALGSAWVASSSGDLGPVLSSSQAFSGTKSMQFSLDRRKSKDEYVTTSFTSSDWSQVEGLIFAFRSTISGSNNTWEVAIYDGSHWATATFQATQANTWEEQSIEFINFSNISSMDMTKIRKIRLTCTKIKSNASCWFDNFKTYGSPLPPLAKIKIFSLASNQVPTTLGNPITLDEGQTYYEVEVHATNRVEHCDINIGAHNTERALTVGNYYGIFIEKPAEGTLYLYGTKTRTYTSGGLYQLNDTTLAPLQGSLGFQTFTTLPTRLKSIILSADAAFEGAEVTLLQEDKTNQDTKFLARLACEPKGNRLVFELTDSAYDHVQLSRYLVLTMFYQDDAMSEVLNLNLQTKHLYRDFQRNG